jgi:hypothetical protein
MDIIHVKVLVSAVRLRDEKTRATIRLFDNVKRHTWIWLPPLFVDTVDCKAIVADIQQKHPTQPTWLQQTFPDQCRRLGKPTDRKEEDRLVFSLGDYITPQGNVVPLEFIIVRGRDVVS